MMSSYPIEGAFNTYLNSAPSDYCPYSTSDRRSEPFVNTSQVMPVFTTTADRVYDKVYQFAKVPCAEGFTSMSMPDNRAQFETALPFDYPCGAKFNDLIQYKTPISSYVVDVSKDDIAGRTEITPKVRDVVPDMLKVDVKNKDFLHADFCHQPVWGEKCV